MTSRERIISAIQHQESNRLPIDFGSMGASGIQAVAYNKLKAYLGVTAGQTRVFDTMLQLAVPEDWILNRFSADAINAGQGFAPHQWKDDTLSDGSSCQIPSWVNIQKRGNERIILNEEGTIVARMVQGGQGFSQTCWPLAHDDWTAHLDDLAEQASSICWRVLPEPIFQGGVSDTNLVRIVNHLKNLRLCSDRAIVGPLGTSLFAAAGGFRGIDNLLMDLVTEQSQVETLLDKIVELHITRLDRLLPAFSNNVDLVWIGDDFGMETGPFLSRKMFCEVFKPRYKIIIDHIKRTSPNIKVFLHCCGSIYQLLGDLIEIG
ncbi:MAG: uroporphyrinogen decarboxylase family protein, partial [Planctomycetota bacterium]